MYVCVYVCMYACTDMSISSLRVRGRMDAMCRHHLGATATCSYVMSVMSRGSELCKSTRFNNKTSVHPGPEAGMEWASHSFQYVQKIYIF